MANAPGDPRREHEASRGSETDDPALRPIAAKVEAGERLSFEDGVTLYGSGDQTRSFCYVDDEVRGLVALLDADITEPVNVGNADEFTMRELAELVIELTESDSPIVTVALPAEREGDPAQRRPDITLASAVLGWKPDVGLRDGLLRTIPWLREALSAQTM